MKRTRTYKSQEIGTSHHFDVICGYLLNSLGISTLPGSKEKKLKILLATGQGEMFHHQEEINQETAIYLMLTMLKRESVTPVEEKQMHVMSLLTLWNLQCRYNLIVTPLLRNSLGLPAHAV